MTDRGTAARSDGSTIVDHRDRRRRSVDLFWRSGALIVLLASTWLIVGASLQEASAAVVSAGRTIFTVGGLLALSWWTMRRGGAKAPDASASIVLRAPSPYRWWQLLLLALSGVSAYTLFSTVAIGFAGPVLPTLIMALTPATVLIAESAMTRVAPAVPTIIGTVLAIGGALLFILPRWEGSMGSDVLIGTLFALAAMGSMAFYGVYFARVNRDYRGPMAPRILPIFALGSIPLVVWAIAAVGGGDVIGWSVVVMLAVLGIAIYVPVYLLQHRIILTAGASYAALLGLAVPPLVGLGSALLHLAAVPKPVQLVGILATMLGMALVIHRRLVPGKPGQRG